MLKREGDVATKLLTVKIELETLKRTKLLSFRPIPQGRPRDIIDEIS